jgi:hypothetical protein
MNRWRGLALVGAAGLALLAGCSGGNSDNAGGGGAAVAPAAGAQERAPDSVAVPHDTGSGTSSGGGTKADPPNHASPLVNTRALIRTAELTVAVDDVTGQAQRAIGIAVEAGGDVYSDQRNNAGAAADHSADIIMKVPPGALQQVLADLAKLGTEQGRSSNTQDVTEQVADVDARVTSARASLARLRTLYSRATTIADITALEGQLSQREADLESLEAQQRSLSSQTATATVTAHLRGRAAAKTTPPPPPPTRNGPSGFLSALKAGWHAFAVSIGWLLTVLGAMLPFLVVLALIGLGARWIDRRVRPRVRPAGAPPAPAPADAG